MRGECQRNHSRRKGYEKTTHRAIIKLLYRAIIKIKRRYRSNFGTHNNKGILLVYKARNVKTKETRGIFGSRELMWGVNES